MDYTKNLRNVRTVLNICFAFVLFSIFLHTPSLPKQNPLPINADAFGLLQWEVAELRSSLQTQLGLKAESLTTLSLIILGLLSTSLSLTICHIEALEAEVSRLTGKTDLFRKADEGKRIGPPSNWFPRFMGTAGRFIGRLFRFV